MSQIEFTETERGFEAAIITDRHGNKIYIWQSSVIGPYEDAIRRPGSSELWLEWETVGDPPVDNMNINRETAKLLKDLFDSWLEIGSFRRDS